MIKYNIILIGMVILISLIYCLNSYFESFSSLGVVVDSGETSINTESEEQIPQILDNEQTTNTVPVFKNGMAAIEYATKKLDSGISYQLDMYHTTNGAGVGTVNVLMKMYRYKNHELMQIWSKCSLPVKDGNFYKSMYNNCDEEQIRFNYDNSRFNFDERTYNFKPEDSISGKYIPTYFENEKVGSWCSYFIDVNSSVAREIYFDKSNQNYYMVKISMNQSKLNDSKYAHTMIQNGVLATNLKQINIVFKIDKKSGYLISCTRDEVFEIVVAGIAPITCTASGRHIYQYYDTKNFILEKAKADHNVGF